MILSDLIKELLSGEDTVHGCLIKAYNRGVESVKKAEYEHLEYKIVRSNSAGVFFGFIESRDGENITMIKARRLWYWEGAASLSQLAMEGTSKPDKCKFPIEVNRVLIIEVIEILDVTQEAINSINRVKIWRA